MARGRNLKSYEDFRRAVRNGYGLGRGSNYKPWLRVSDVKSQGLSTKIKGLKTHRIHHFFSKIETEFFHFADVDPNVIDIREQFPLLPLDLSVRIAAELGIKHPKVPGTSVNIVMTTDFLLTLQEAHSSNYLAISAKPREALADQRLMEKQEIERQWWSLLGIPFRVYCGNEQTRVQAKNLADICVYHRKGYNLDAVLADHAISAFNIGIYRLDQCIALLSQHCDIKASTARKLLFALIENGYLIVPLTSPILETGIVKIIDTRLGKVNNVHRA